MRYFFILGRNIPLSKAEVFSFLKRKSIRALKHEEFKNGLMVETDKKLENKDIELLGGVIAIGEVFEDIERAGLFFGKGNKLSYAVWNFSDKTEELQDYLKARFKEEKLKANEVKLLGEMITQEGESYEVLSSKKTDEEYFAFGDYFGRIIQKCDYKKLERRDMEKPVRREELSIAPRLAKIMINLSEAKLSRGGADSARLADVFCGIGVILSEALLQGMNVVGVDIDGRAILGAKKNLAWMKIPEDRYKLINSDSRSVSLPKADVIVSEPDLGEILKKSPNPEIAKNTLEKFEKLMIGVLNNCRRSISGKIVFSAPTIKSARERVSCNIRKICSGTGLNLAAGPFSEYREGQIVGREIYILE